MKSKTLFYLLLLTLFALLIPAMHAQTYSVIYTFRGHTDGASPAAGVTIRGNALYGTTSIFSTVYQLAPSGSNWSFATLATLPHNGGASARPMFGPDGHLYSTSASGGKYGYGGTVFTLTPPVGICRTVACYWTVNDLHDFNPDTEGYELYGGDLIWDKQGNIYGTTGWGGSTNNGIVWELTPSGNGYTEDTIHDFSGGADGAGPYGGLVLDQQGNLFGIACGGGSNGFGNVFELSYVPGIGWTQHVLYNFQNGDDGGYPFGGLIFDASGNLYGTTSYGGSSGGGTVFELSPSGDTWTFKLLASLTVGVEGYGSFAALSRDGAGNLYGTTATGGIYGQGNVFKLSNTENGWAYASLYDFTRTSDGGNPYGSVTIATDGTLYGTTQGGGIFDYPCTQYAIGCGVVWMIKP